MNENSEKINRLRKRGDAAQQAKVEFNQLFAGEGLGKRDPNYSSRLKNYKELTKIAFPENWPLLLDEINSQNEKAIEEALTFLEADPNFNNSGYIKQKIIRHLKRAQLDEAYKNRLALLVVGRINNAQALEFSAYGKLAIALKIPELDKQIMELSRSTDVAVAKRANWMLKILQSRRLLS